MGDTFDTSPKKEDSKQATVKSKISPQTTSASNQTMIQYLGKSEKGTRILDFLGKIQQIWEKTDPLREGAEHLSALTQGLTLLSGSQKDIQALDENLNALDIASKNLQKALISLSKKDTNYWIEKSGVNLGSLEETEKGINYLITTKDSLAQIQSLCEDPAIELVNFFLIYSFFPLAIPLTSLKALDPIVADRAKRNFRNCSQIIQSQIISKLEQAISISKKMRESQKAFFKKNQQHNTKKEEPNT